MAQFPNAPAPIIAVVGWKNSGKTTLAVRLIETFIGRGYRVASIKHAHHSLCFDNGDTDSARHRRAGAAQVAVVSQKRWALVSEGDEPDFAEVISRLDPCDLIVVEGYKVQPIPKIEARREGAAKGARIAEQDPNVIAIAADHAVEGASVPVFALDDVQDIADFITSAIGLGGDCSTARARQE